MLHPAAASSEVETGGNVGIFQGTPYAVPYCCRAEGATKERMEDQATPSNLPLFIAPWIRGVRRVLPNQVSTPAEPGKALGKHRTQQSAHPLRLFRTCTEWSPTTG